jgi:hypothetical protein
MPALRQTQLPPAQEGMLRMRVRQGGKAKTRAHGEAEEEVLNFQPPKIPKFISICLAWAFLSLAHISAMNDERRA